MRDGTGRVSQKPRRPALACWLRIGAAPGGIPTVVRDLRRLGPGPALEAARPCASGRSGHKQIIQPCSQRGRVGDLHAVHSEAARKGRLGRAGRLGQLSSAGTQAAGSKGRPAAAAAAACGLRYDALASASDSDA